jgi:hypothetical protein
MTWIQIDRGLVLGGCRVRVPHPFFDHAEPVMRVGLAHRIGGRERKETSQRRFAAREMLP